MKRRQFLHAAGMVTASLGAALAGTGASRAQTAAEGAPGKAEPKPVVWRLVSDFPEALDTPRAGVEALANTLTAITDGAFTVNAASQPQKTQKQPASALDAVREGKAEIAYTSTAFYADRDPVFGVGGGMPFGPNARQFSAWLLDRGGLDLLNDAYRSHGVLALPGGNTGAITGGWFKQEIAGVEGLAGKRVGVTGTGAALLARFGALPQPIPPQDLAAALTAGRIDIAQWTGPHDDERLGLNKGAPFYYYPGWQGGLQFSFIIARDAWDALSAPHRAALTAAAARAHDTVQARYDALNAAAIRRLVALGTKLRPTPQAMMSQLYTANQALTAEIADTNPAFRTLSDSVKIFSTEAYLWWQVAEYTYDNFMIRVRAQD
ncbi:TRAP transporter substrate-binding protein [Pseudochelatococcus contaminans]|uniref:TRAP-type mannitol/chloroaromatic compound transport system substrate-binding protein n=1 Tax=Pseudochelatococcus contaminans TaxID=1538103 RepID=A0A7W5Z2W9_9HYPH|nr:ABC transporter substrate-binding protein [Pseudochelatococcus contaminans]MBB3809009.1 TRAP-type mannitol/chloroaromatic compound transport system substrate-binding protein [Pseudochelatococcus contaminans]